MISYTAKHRGLGGTQHGIAGNYIIIVHIIIEDGVHIQVQIQMIG